MIINQDTIDMFVIQKNLINKKFFKKKLKITCLKKKIVVNICGMK